jgi:all-trans-8'-apo-beta-carotenal 15,15'-oxygenase
VLKVDTLSKTEVKWLAQPHEFIGEPIFMPKASGQADEDDGYIVCTLHDCKSMKSYTLLFDAKDLEKGPAVKSEHPVFVPQGLHGTFANGITHNFDDITRRFKVVFYPLLRLDLCFLLIIFSTRLRKR